MPMLTDRSAGVLLHPTSLPSRYGIGDLGPGADRYLAWLADAGVGWWQVLPLHPPGPGNSPYSAISCFAGSELLISPTRLVEDGLVGAEDLARVPDLPSEWVDFEQAKRFKGELLRTAFANHRAQRRVDLLDAVAAFRQAHRQWLDDFALYQALKRAHGDAAWYDWPRPLAFRDPAALSEWSGAHRDEVEVEVFSQFLFFRQWAQVREAAERHGVSILGDVPIFVALDSADVWAHPELFLLDDERHPTVVGGAPPDYFSDTGQLWGNPLYDWDRMREHDYSWWISRLRHELELADAVRIDHFRGFAAHWEVPADHEVATDGRWVEGPGRPFFDAVSSALGGLPLVAEDLGEITQDVVDLRKDLGLPGMAILHFAFNPDEPSLFLPYRLERDLVVYTGTHDNNTTVGWFLEDASEPERRFVCSYCGTDGSEIHWDLIRLALASVSNLAIIPHQDLVGLGSDCRMNTPAVAAGNWSFRITQWMLAPEIRSRFAEMNTTYGRARTGHGREPTG
jgi:4-alpha-glucanotransferase